MSWVWVEVVIFGGLFPSGLYISEQWNGYIFKNISCCRPPESQLGPIESDFNTLLLSLILNWQLNDYEFK